MAKLKTKLKIVLSVYQIQNRCRGCCPPYPTQAPSRDSRADVVHRARLRADRANVLRVSLQLLQQIVWIHDVPAGPGGGHSPLRPDILLAPPGQR